MAKGKRESIKLFVGNIVAVNTHTTPIPRDTHIFLQADEINSDNSTHGNISKNEYPKFLPNSSQKSFPISNQCETQNAIEAASMASTTTLIIEVKTNFPKKMELSLIGSDFIFCIALSANSV